MTTTEALAKRRSIRAFLPDMVEQDTLAAIFEAAARTPSWANSQPWEVFVAAGKTLERIKKGYREHYANGVSAAPETPRPAAWTQQAIKRREQLHPAMQRDCGAAAGQFGQLNQAMFNAPAVIYICMDQILSEWSLYDIGAYSQSLMLAATQYGLGTIPAMTLTLYPDVLRRELKLPDNLKITIGIAIGYPDTQHGINNFKSERVPVEQAVRFFN
jgi:Nitroreductase